MILENEILKNKLKTRDELEDLKTMESYEEYIGLIDSVSFDTIVPDIKNTLKEYVQYIDMDKLLLISAYRFYELLHEEDLEKELHEGIKDILEEILNNIKSNNASICCRLQSKKDNSYELQEITYSVNDIKKCISQFAGKVYLSSEEIEEYREKINNKEINLLQIDSEYIDVIFSKRELEELSKLSPENLLYVFNEYKWDISKIIELYENQAISIEHIRKIKEYIDLSESVNFEKLSLYYNQLDSNKEAIEKYEIYLMLYKEIFINDTNAEEITQNSNIVMEKIAEMYEGEEYHKAVKHYYKQGLITIDVIAEWNNESFIMELFNENIITIDVISKLVNDNKFPVIYLNQIYDNLLTNKDMEYNERISLIKKGFTNESVIFDLYKKNLIFEEDLRKLAEEGFVRKQEMQNLINSRTLSELEKNSAIVLTGLNSLTKKNNDIYYDKSEGTYGHKNTKSTGKFIIDPNERERFIRLLKAYKANTDLNEDSPFYNYDFYVIPDESGTIGLNSVVIAERYYEDKYSQTKFATNNATYFFKYKDLMVLSNLRKSEMTKERQDIVFTANHVIANEKREGNWAKSVISSIVKTMISSDLKEYSRENQKIIIMKKLSEIYTPQEMKEILEMATQIDFGEYRGEIEAPIERRAKNNSAPKGDDISDTAETR